MPLPNCWMNLPLPRLLALQARLQWLRTARPSQTTPAGDWRLWLILAGRGWGKTRTGAEDLAHYALRHDGARLAVVAPTFADARDTCVEGESGLLKVLPEACVQSWHRSLGALRLHNGSRIKLFSADRPERLRGPQHHRVWCDELGAWARPETFDQVLFGLRLGDAPRLVITTTPRPLPLNDNQFAALVCFAFNVGAENLANSTLRRLLQRGWYEQVPAQLMRWNKARGEALGGLTRRRAAEAQLWNRTL